MGLSEAVPGLWGGRGCLYFYLYSARHQFLSISYRRRADFRNRSISFFWQVSNFLAPLNVSTTGETIERKSGRVDYSEGRNGAGRMGALQERAKNQKWKTQQITERVYHNMGTREAVRHQSLILEWSQKIEIEADFWRISSLLWLSRIILTTSRSHFLIRVIPKEEDKSIYKIRVLEEQRLRKVVKTKTEALRPIARDRPRKNRKNDCQKARSPCFFNGLACQMIFSKIWEKMIVFTLYPSITYTSGIPSCGQVLSPLSHISKWLSEIVADKVGLQDTHVIVAGRPGESESAGRKTPSRPGYKRYKKPGCLSFSGTGSLLNYHHHNHDFTVIIPGEWWTSGDEENWERGESSIGESDRRGGGRANQQQSVSRRVNGCQGESFGWQTRFWTRSSSLDPID